MIEQSDPIAAPNDKQVFPGPIKRVLHFCDLMDSKLGNKNLGEAFHPAKLDKVLCYVALKYGFEVYTFESTCAAAVLRVGAELIFLSPSIM